MIEILANLKNPSWWFTGLFFTFLLWVIPKAFRKVEPLARGLAKRSKLRNLKQVKTLRWDPLQIQYLISRANANYTIFVALIVLFILVIVFTPAREALKSPSLALLCASPVFLFELLWLTSDSTAKEAIKARRRIGRRQPRSSSSSSKPTSLRGAA